MQADTLSRRTIIFVNIAHAFDHFVLLIYPTAVIAIAVERGLEYGTLIGSPPAHSLRSACFRCRWAGSPSGEDAGTCSRYFLSATACPAWAWRRLARP